MKKNNMKSTIYARIFIGFFAIYLVLMVGFSIFLIVQENKVESLELRTFALFGK